jgi:hypothetical protein
LHNYFKCTEVHKEYIMSKKNNTAAAVVTATPAKEAFSVKSHSKRSEIKGAARNHTIKGRGVTIYMGLVNGKLNANSTTQVDYITGTKEGAYKKFCQEQPSHAWMKAITKDGFIYLGSDAMGSDAAWSPEEASEVRSAVQKAISSAVETSWTGRLTSKGVPLPANAQAEIDRAVQMVQEFMAPAAAENTAEVAETVAEA